jgi:hypothetical protein
VTDQRLSQEGGRGVEAIDGGKEVSGNKEFHEMGSELEGAACRKEGSKGYGAGVGGGAGDTGRRGGVTGEIFRDGEGPNKVAAEG